MEIFEFQKIPLLHQTRFRTLIRSNWLQLLFSNYRWYRKLYGGFWSKWLINWGGELWVPMFERPGLPTFSDRQELEMWL